MLLRHPVTMTGVAYGGGIAMVANFAPGVCIDLVFVLVVMRLPVVAKTFDVESVKRDERTLRHTFVHDYIGSFKRLTGWMTAGSHSLFRKRRIEDSVGGV